MSTTITDPCPCCAQSNCTCCNSKFPAPCGDGTWPTKLFVTFTYNDGPCTPLVPNFIPTGPYEMDISGCVYQTAPLGAGGDRVTLQCVSSNGTHSMEVGLHEEFNDGFLIITLDIQGICCGAQVTDGTTSGVCTGYPNCDAPTPMVWVFKNCLLLQNNVTGFAFPLFCEHVDITITN